jgi:hypothetical protein
MKRLILTAPTGLTLDQLTPEQQVAIQSVFAQFTLPMPGTIEFNATVILDAITADNFNPDVLVPLGLPFGILGMWQWDGSSDVLIELQPLDIGFINYLPDVHTYDNEGNVLTTTAPTLHIPCGWQQVVL